MYTRLFLASLLSMALMAAGGCKGADTPKAKTIANLKAGIIGETTASAKYAAYAAKAKEEGYAKIALLFEAASKAEGIHANKHTSVLEQLGEKMEKVTPVYEVKTTKENLEDAIKGESHEIESMYPEFIKTARDAVMADAVTTFDYAFQVEKKHLALYKDALAALEKKDFKGLADAYAVCSTCGNTFGKTVPNNCEICGDAKDTFITIK